MAELIKCPNCGASDAEKKSETEFVCNYCESQFVLGQKRKQTTVDDAMRQMHRMSSSSVNPVAAAKSIRLVGLIIFISVLGVSIGIFVSVNNAVNNAIEAGPGSIAENEYWNAASPSKFHVFEGSQGPVIWILLNQSSKKLDSSKYTLQIIDPKRKRVVFEEELIRMTWNESFNFNNYLSEMISCNDKVYFLSDANGIRVYDLYRGKEELNNRNFANFHLELDKGIASAKNVYYKTAFELMTNDGFKFYYFPQSYQLVSEKEFNDYPKARALIGGFVVSDAPRQKLYYIISEQDTLRNDFSFSEYYLNQYLRNGKSGEKKERGFEVDTTKTFFNVNYLLRNKEQVVFLYTENVSKDSKAKIISYSKEDFTKPLWEIELNSVKGFEKSMKDGYYLRTSSSKKELAIWYESATRIAFGLDLKTGKINWNYQLK